MAQEKKLENKLKDWGIIVASFGIGIWAIFQIFPGVPLALGLSTVPGVGAAPAAITTSGGGCADTGLTNLNFKASYINVGSNNDDTLANTTVAVYKTGEQTAFLSSTTGTGGYITVGTADCNDKGLTAYIGDHGTTYYEVEKSFDAVSAANTEVSATLKKSVALTYTFSNGVTFGAANTTVSAGSGATVTDVFIKLKAGQYYYGDGAQEICASFPTNNISNVYFTFDGATLPSLPGDPSISTAAGSLTKCYELSGDLNNYVSKDVNVIIQSAAGITPLDALVGINVNDKASYIKNGELLFGYYNPDTNADLGLAKVALTTAIEVN